MPGLAALDVVLGLIFVYLLFSLLATAISELIAHVFSLRGRNLLNAIKYVAGDDLIRKLKEDPYIKTFAAKRGGQIGKENKHPEFIAASDFVRVLVGDIFQNVNTEGHALKNELQSRLGEAAVSEDVKKMLHEVVNQHGDTLEQFKKGLEIWYEDMVALSLEWYKKKIRWVLFGIGLVISIAFNADTLRIVHTLNNNPQAHVALVAQAEAYMAVSQDNPALQDSTINTDSLQIIHQKITNLIDQQVSQAATVLGMGWKGVDHSFGSWALRLCGWLLTAIAISFGAPFWFDLLRKVINLKNALQQTSEERTSGQAPPAASRAVG